jgi:carotenoid cleavage dioxygenase-like enzyme
VHRTAFTRGAADGSLLFNPFDFTLKNVANTGVLNWGGRLLALYEVRMLRCGWCHLVAGLLAVVVL